MKISEAKSSCGMRRNKLRRQCSCKKDAGFILPMAVLLVIMLAISGTSFMQLDFLERRMTMNNVRNHDAFYLANAGIERAREVFKIDTTGSAPTWTPILSGTAPYAIENPQDPTLCVAGKNCIIPPFGALVTSPSLPFDNNTYIPGTDPNRAFYAARAFNDEAGNVDANGILTIRALGNVRGEQKVLQINVQATSGLKLINCQGEVGTSCPDSVHQNATITYMDGRRPSATPVLPSLPPLANPSNPTTCNPANLYCDRTKLTGLNLTNTITLNGSSTLSSLQNNTYYFVRGNVTIKSTGTNTNVAIIALGSISTQGNVTLNNAILVSGTSVSMQGNLTIRGVLPFPAVISSGALNADNSVTIFGAVYANGPIDFRPLQLHGVIIGQDVTLQAAATLVTDDGNAAYYGLMPGFTYPSDLKMTVVAVGSWQELQ